MRIGDFKLRDGAITEVTRGEVTLTPDFRVLSYDERAHEFLGSNVKAIFYDIAPSDYKDELKAFLEELPENKEDRIFTFIVDRNDIPHIVDIKGHHSGNPDEGAFLEIFDIDRVYSLTFYALDCMWKYRALLGMVNGIYFDYDFDGDEIAFYRYVGKKATKLFGGSMDDFHEAMIKYADESEKNITACEQFYEQMCERRINIKAKLISGFLHKDNKLQNLEITARFDSGNQHSRIYGFINVPDELASDDLPYYMTDAGMDSMTGLLNKKALVEYSEDIFTNPSSSNKKHYMILLDIDDFKNINDGFGHQAGDKAIQILASTLTDVLGDKSIIGRYGGDEFYVLTNVIEDEETLRSHLRLARSIAEQRAKEQLGVEKFTLSMGVALYPEVGKTYTELLSIADKCLYIAKEKGKNRYIIYRPEMHEDVVVGAARKSSTYDEESKAVSQALHLLYNNGKSSLNEALQIIAKGFDTDNIDLFYGEGLPTLTHVGKYESGFTAADFVDNEKYMDQFSVDGQHVMNNYNNLRRTLPDMFTMLDDKKCMSLLQLALPNPDEPKFFISFNVFNRIHKWSTAEVNYLTMFGSLLYDVLEKE